ncbi:MAG: endonuclease MutS2, partial [Alistipes sp.]|nr:endonuclease MutS2 [Alistipes sp.]
MIYPSNFEQKIGFDRIREQIAALCTMQAARERLSEQCFSNSREEIERRLDLADEMRTILILEREFPDSEYVDVEPLVAKIAVEGAFLDVEEVVRLGVALRAIGEVVGFIQSRGRGAYPALY